MDERDITPEAIEREHLAEIPKAAHWAYMAAVIGFGLVAMLVLMAVLERIA